MLLLYENQTAHNLNGKYSSKSIRDSAQNLLPLNDVPISIKFLTSLIAAQPVGKKFSEAELPVKAVALLGIITELPSRYSLDGLAASVGSERVGLAVWIIDQRLGVNAEPDEETVKLAISQLAEQELVKIRIRVVWMRPRQGRNFGKKQRNNLIQKRLSVSYKYLSKITL